MVDIADNDQIICSYNSDYGSDSDDELLGITNGPITIKTIPRSYNKTWNNMSSESLDNDGISPTMEIIDVSNFKMEQKLDKSNKYQRMREIKNIIGFIVNVHDATNFDIDLEIPPELHEKYRDVISNQYTYQDLGADFLENPDLNRLKIKAEVGTTYRCRLKGVGINQLPPGDHTYRSNLMCIEVKQLIDRTDGWVVCTLSDIDVYQRLLVDVVIHTSSGPINLRDFLLTKMKSEENPIFYPYAGKRGNITTYNDQNRNLRKNYNYTPRYNTYDNQSGWIRNGTRSYNRA